MKLQFFCVPVLIVLDVFGSTFLFYEDYRRVGA